MTLRGASVFASATGFSFGGAGGEGIFRSDDGGQSWVRSDTGIPVGRSVNGVANVGSTLYATTVIAQFPQNLDDGVYASVDGGATWTLTQLSGMACSPITGVGGTPMVGVPGRGGWRQGSTCYANCDGSTAAPVLNVQDFSCFLNRFAQGDPYANCDASTTTPVLNVQDFSCFLNRFAVGCP
jgi:hypothetical protein